MLSLYYVTSDTSFLEECDDGTADGLIWAHSAQDAVAIWRDTWGLEPTATPDRVVVIQTTAAMPGHAKETEVTFA